jgi:hypothetical protein
MRLAHYFEPDAVRNDLYLVRDYVPDEMGSLVTHMSDLVCNLDMLLVAVKGFSATRTSVRYNPEQARVRLHEAREYLERLLARMDEAEELAQTL